MSAPTMTRGLPEDAFVTDTDEMRAVLTDTLTFLLMRTKPEEPPIQRSPRELLRCRGHLEERQIDARQIMTAMTAPMARAFIAREVAYWIRELGARDRGEDDKPGQAASVWVPSAFSVEYRRRGMKTSTTVEGGAKPTASPISIGATDQEGARQLAELQSALASQRPIQSVQEVKQQVDCFVITVAYSDVSANKWADRKYRAGVLKSKTARSQEQAHALIRARFDVEQTYVLEHDEIQIAARYVDNVEAARLTKKQAEDALYLKSIERNGKEKARRHSYAVIAADVARWRAEQEDDADIDPETEQAIRTMIALGEPDQLILGSVAGVTIAQVAKIRTAVEKEGPADDAAPPPAKPKAPRAKKKPKDEGLPPEAGS